MIGPVTVREAQRHLSRLLERVAEGESVVITRSGRPIAKLAPLGDAPAADQRVGFLAGGAIVPDDFDRMGSAEIEPLFGGGPSTP